jgi:hypothetical protein
VLEALGGFMSRGDGDALGERLVAEVNVLFVDAPVLSGCTSCCRPSSPG